MELIDRLEAMPRLIYVERLDMVKPTEAAGPLSVSMVVHAFHHNHEALGVFARKGAATQP